MMNDTLLGYAGADFWLCCECAERSGHAERYRTDDAFADGVHLIIAEVADDDWDDTSLPCDHCGRRIIPEPLRCHDCSHELNERETQRYALVGTQDVKPLCNACSIRSYCQAVCIPVGTDGLPEVPYVEELRDLRALVAYTFTQVSRFNAEGASEHTLAGLRVAERRIKRALGYKGE